MNAQPSLLTRSDTLFGVCQGLGEDIGISPLFFRLAFTVLLFFQPAAALCTYAGAGVLVFLARLLAPAPRPVAEPHPVAVPTESETEHLPLAA